MPNWPVGTRSKGNEGVTASLKTTPNSVAYIEFGYAQSQKLPMAIWRTNRVAMLRRRQPPDRRLSPPHSCRTT
jgi:ABC-type phosphate transport system substrate-binding protein